MTTSLYTITLRLVKLICQVQNTVSLVVVNFFLSEGIGRLAGVGGVWLQLVGCPAYSAQRLRL